MVAQAKVTLKDAQSGSQRETVSNNDGYFTFASVPVGTYDLTVEAKGFNLYKVTGIALGGGEKRNVDVGLQVGTTNQTVEITGMADQLVAVDSGEKSATLTTKELQNYVQTGSNAAEYIKIMPGFGVQNGTSNKSNYTGETIGINGNGDAGSQSPLNNAYSYNGLPTNSLDITADGAHVSDPGCNCDTPVNPNSDMISEFKVMTSNFSAENQKGPAVISSVAKSGGKDFHGSDVLLRTELRLERQRRIPECHSACRARRTSTTTRDSPIGGPVLIPGTRFNKNRNKLFFFTGFEYFYQVLDTGVAAAQLSRRPANSPAISRPPRSPRKATSPPPGALPDRLSRRGVPRRNHSREPARQEHAEPDEAVSATQRRPQFHRRIQLCAGRDLQSEQYSVDVARGLQHQRQHQALRPI